MTRMQAYKRAWRTAPNPNPVAEQMSAEFRPGWDGDVYFPQEPSTIFRYPQAPDQGKIRLPRKLARPVIDQQPPHLTRLLALLGEPSVENLVTSLLAKMPEFAKSVQSVTVPQTHYLSTQIQIGVNHLTTVLPTHVLALRNSSGNEIRRLYAAHNTIIVVYCLKIPPLPRLIPLPTTGPRRSLEVPVVKLNVPHPDSFGSLLDFLYVKDSMKLATALMFPITVPPSTFEDCDPSSCALARMLVEGFTQAGVIQFVNNVKGIGENAYTVGINDQKLWHTLDVLWHELTTAMDMFEMMPPLLPLQS